MAKRLLDGGCMGEQRYEHLLNDLQEHVIRTDCHSISAEVDGDGVPHISSCWAITCPYCGHFEEADMSPVPGDSYEESKRCSECGKCFVLRYRVVLEIETYQFETLDLDGDEE